MATTTSVLRLPIDGQRELHVVLQDRARKVTFSLVTDPASAYRERTTFELPLADAFKLARFIAGIQSALRTEADDPRAFDEETTPVEVPEPLHRARTAEGIGVDQPDKKPVGPDEPDD